MTQLNAADLNEILDRLAANPDQLEDVKQKLQKTLKPQDAAFRSRVYQRLEDDEEDDLFDNVPV